MQVITKSSNMIRIIQVKEKKSLFDTLAENSLRFVAGDSSSFIKNFNATIVNEASKFRLYRTSQSGDFRIGCEVVEKK